LLLFYIAKHVETGTVRKIDVEQREAGLFLRNELFSLSYALGLQRFITPAPERFGQSIANCRFVIYNKDLSFWSLHKILFYSPGSLEYNGLVTSEQFAAGVGNRDFAE
jgi:hypothetical protein